MADETIYIGSMPGGPTQEFNTPPPGVSIEINKSDDDWFSESYGERIKKRHQLAGPTATDLQNNKLDPRNVLDNNAFATVSPLLNRMMEPYQETGKAILDVNEEVANSLGKAAYGIGQGFLDLTDELGETLGNLTNFPGGHILLDDDGLNFSWDRPDNYNPITIPKFFSEPETIAGNIGSGLMQFVGSMALLNAGRLGQIPLQWAKWSSIGAVSDALFDPVEGGFSSMLMEMGVEPNLVLEFLDPNVDENSTAEEKIVGRLKLALEGSLIGVPIDIILGGLRTVKKIPQLRDKIIGGLQNLTGDVTPQGLATVQGPMRVTGDQMPLPFDENPRLSTLEKDQLPQEAAAQEEGIAKGEIDPIALKGETIAKFPPEARIAFDLDNLGFYSQALRTAENLKQEKGNSQQMRNMLLKEAGVREEELAWTGLDDFFNSKKKVTKQEIIEHLKANRVVIREKQGVAVSKDGYGDYDGETFPLLGDNQREVVDFNEAYPDGDYDYELENFRDELQRLQNSSLEEYEKLGKEYFAIRNLEEIGVGPDSSIWTLDKEKYATIIREEFDKEIFDPDNVIDKLNAQYNTLDEALYERAKERYLDNPTYRWTDPRHGYEITGNDDFGYTLYAPDGERNDFNNFNDAYQGANEDAMESGYIEYLDEEGMATYANYTMPGGKNYREMFFYFDEPKAGPYHEPHFTGKDFAENEMAEFDDSYLEATETLGENILAHARLKDDIYKEKVGYTKEGKEKFHKHKLLRIEEIQAQWHKKVGYTEDGKRKYRKKYKKGGEKEALDKAEKALANYSEVNSYGGLLKYVVSGVGHFRPITKSTIDNITKTKQIIDGNDYLKYDYERAENKQIFDLFKENVLGTNAPLKKFEFFEMPVPDIEYNRLLHDRLEAQYMNQIASPDAPFKAMDERGWPQMVMRRIMRYAAENDYDMILYSPGYVQAERYNAPTELYDKTIPKIVKKIVKKFDKSVGKDEIIEEIPSNEILPELNDTENRTIPVVRLTSKMRESIKRLGQALFIAPPLAVGVNEAMQQQQEQQPPPL